MKQHVITVCNYVDVTPTKVYYGTLKQSVT